MILPLLLEQLLVMLIGVADTFIVSFAGEAAVSGVSLVNAFNTIFIYLFTALASGGAVVISQYIGNKARDLASEAASQLLMVSALFSIVISGIILMAHIPLMRLLFGQVEPAVMEACITYLKISVYSYPALAVYNAGAALYRSIGKTSTTMYISIAANILNVVGNLIGVFVLRAGVAGVAYPSLLARVFSAVAITVLCLRDANLVRYRKEWIAKWNGTLQKQMLRIAVPNGIENGVFQLVKVALSSVVALFGTYQIAANGIAQTIWALSALMGVTMGPVFITVIGQCMGAGDRPAAETHFRKLLKITVVLSVLWNGVVFAATPLFMTAYDLAAETKQLVITLVLIHNLFNAFAFPFWGPLGNGLRAAGDVRFTMIVSIITTVLVRLACSLLFAVVLNLGVIGIAYAMCLDWIVRGAIFYVRMKSGKWKEFKII